MLYLIRFGGEVTTKSRNTRRQFQAQLARNIRAGLIASGVPGEVTADWSRFFVESADPRAADVLGRVFGIQSFSPVIVRPAADLDEAVRSGLDVFQDEVKGARFAVRARVTRNDHSPAGFRARDVECALGAALLPYAERVDLTDPDVTAHIEVRDRKAYCFTMILPGAGGLPLGVQDKAVALVSGGYDSAVAAWMVLRRGVFTDYLYCNLGTSTQLAAVMEVLEVLARRWSHGSKPRLHVVDFGPVATDIAANVRGRFVQLVLKRRMLAAADMVAKEIHAAALVTGDAIGQVSSQTLRNLAAMAGAAELPILRPLVGMDKHEIVRWAEHIGTAELSARVAELCALTPHHPATSARLDAVLAEEATLDPDLLTGAVAARRVMNVARLENSDPLEIDHVPPGATVVDMRTAAAFAQWHYPGAVHMPLEVAGSLVGSFRPGELVVAYCGFGAKSALLAQALRRRGVIAYTFEGGTRALLAQSLDHDAGAVALTTGILVDDD